MPTIEKLIEYTIPFFGNRRCLPYGKMLISGGGKKKVCEIREDGVDQYIIFNRKRYYIQNNGSLYSPCFEFIC